VLLDCAEQLMVREGYAAVTYRKLAASAGVSPPLVQYYFPTLDAMFTAIVERRTEENLQRLATAIQQGHPLRALWEHASDKAGARLTAELMALANHRTKIRDEIGQAGERIRALVLGALAAAEYDPPREPVSAEALVFLLTSVPRMIIMEAAAGMSASHDATTAFVERYLDQLEPRAEAEGAGC
jgi:AcrR family transcriptional regulator